MTIQELEHLFNTVELPKAPVMPNPSSTITDVDHFLQSHFYPLKVEQPDRLSQPLLDRLLAFKLLIESNL